MPIPTHSANGSSPVISRPPVHLVVVMPALNEGETIGEVVRGIPRDIEGVDTVEILVVDDGSSDDTQRRALEAGADAIVVHARNRGLVAAFTAGVYEALRRGATVVVHLDADGQHDPAAIPDMIAPIVSRSADIMVGVRPFARAKGEMGAVRRHGNRAGSWFCTRVLGVPASDATSGYRAFSRDALLRLNLTSDHTYTVESLLQATRKRLRVHEIEVPIRPRLVGESRMTKNVLRYVRRTGGHAFRAAIHHQPMAVFGRAATLLGIAALASLVYFIIGRTGGGSHQAAFLFTVISAVAAVGMLVAGIIADAIAVNRRLLEDSLYHIKRLELGAAGTETVSRDRHHDLDVVTDLDVEAIVISRSEHVPAAVGVELDTGE